MYINHDSAAAAAPTCAKSSRTAQLHNTHCALARKTSPARVSSGMRHAALRSLVLRIINYPHHGITASWLGLNKILLYFEAVVHESTIVPFPSSTCIAHPGAILLHDYWPVYDSPSDLPCVCYTLYNIGQNNIV